MRSVALFSFLFLILVTFSSASLFWVQDAYNHTDESFQPERLGNLTIEICGNSSGTQFQNDTFSNFTIWNETGVIFNLSDANQQGLYTVCGTSAFSNESVLSNVSIAACVGNQPDMTLGVQGYYQCAKFVTNMSYADSYNPGKVINVTSNRTAIGENTLTSYNLTVNAIRITGAPNMVVMRWNATNITALDMGPGAIASDGVFAMHKIQNTCLWHGIRPLLSGGGPFGPQQSAQTGFDCYPLATGTETDDWLMHFDFTTSNGSTTTRRNSNSMNLDPQTRLAITNIRLDSFCFGGFEMQNSCLSYTGFNATIRNATGDIVYNGSVEVPRNGPGGPGEQDAGGAPAFLEPYKQYTVNVTGRLNSTNTDHYYYQNVFPYLSLAPGINGIVVNIFNQSGQYTYFKGQAFNSTGQPLANAIVLVRKNNGFSPPDGIDFINASLTDANGVYTVRVAKSQNVNRGFADDNEDTYKITIMSNATDELGNLKYFPTENDNNGRGFRASGDVMFVTPTTVLDASTITMNVTLNGATNIMVESALYKSGVLKDTKIAQAKKIAPIKLFSNVDVPANTYIYLLVPAGNVLFNLFGMASGNEEGEGQRLQTANSICFFRKNIIAGIPTTQDCNLTTPAVINFTIGRCGSQGFGPDAFRSIFNCTDTTKDQGMLWANQFLIYNASSGELISSAEEGTFQREQNFALEFNGGGGPGPAPKNQTIKFLVEGGTNYSIKIVPRFEWSPSLNIITKSINTTQNVTSNFTINTSMPWDLQGHMNGTFNASANNTIIAAVFDHTLVTPGSMPMCEGPGPCLPPDLLNDTSVEVYAYVLLLNGSYAGNFTSPIQFTFQSSGLNAPGIPGAGFNASFKPKDFNMTAGKFKVAIVARNQSYDNNIPSLAPGVNNFSVIKEFPITVSDFNIAVTPSKSAFATSDAITGKIFAVYPNGTKIDGTVTLDLYDESNTIINSTSYSVTDGAGAFSLLQAVQLPAGNYELVASMNASNLFGFSSSFIKVADFIVDAKFDRARYSATENATLTATVKFANGTAIQGASVEINVDGSQSSFLNFTGSNGKATFTLDPAVMAQNGQWSPGFRFVDVKISAQSGVKVSKQRLGVGFEVKGVEIDMHTERFSYTKDEQVKVYIMSATQPTLYLDGTAIPSGDFNEISGGYRVTLLPPDGGWSGGFHNLRAEVTSGSNKQNIFRGFEVNVLNIQAWPASMSYSVNQNATINVRVMDSSSGSPVPVNGATVTFAFNKFQGMGPMQLGITQNTTSANGETTGTFNVTSSGFHFVEITVQKDAVTQKQFAGFFVTGLNLLVELNQQTYAPSETAIINVTVRDGSNNPIEGATVEGQVRSFNEFTNLASNTTDANGITNLTYAIPNGASSQMKFIELRISTPTGENAFTGTELRIEGYRVIVRPTRPNYQPGENVTILADLRDTSNTPVEGQSLTFELMRPGKIPVTLGTSATDSKGSANVTFNTTVQGITNDGFYAVRVYSNQAEGLQSIAGFSISSLTVTLNLNASRVTVGQTIQFQVNIRDSNGLVLPTNLELEIWNAQKGKFTLPITIAGPQPYTLEMSVPNEPNSLGQYSVTAIATNGVSKGMGRAMLFVENNTASMNMTIIASPVEDEEFNVTLQSSENSNSEVTLRVFSPGAGSIANQTTTNLVAGYKNISLTLTDPGQYVFVAESAIYGTITTARFIAPLEGSVLFYAQNSTYQNTTNFATGAQVSFYTNKEGSTVSIIYNNSGEMIENSVPLIQVGEMYTGNYTLPIEGDYMARLDTTAGSGVAALMLSAS